MISLPHGRGLVLAAGVVWIGVLALAGDAVPVLTWNSLRGLNSKTGEMSAFIKQANKHVVRIAGFMVPLEDEDDNVTEFLLVPWAGACIRTPPPPPNQIVDVNTGRGKKVKVEFEAPFWVQGRLEVVTVKSPYGYVSYKMSDTVVTPYEEK